MIDYLSWFQNWPPELATFFMAMIPITELRASIPVAIWFFQLSPLTAYLISVLGDVLPAIFILYILGPVSQFLITRSILARKFFDWWFARVQRKFEKKYAKWGAFALVIFVGIPLPFTGTWTGAVAAWLFGIKYRIAIFAIILGALLAGFIITMASLGAFSFILI